MGDAEGVAKPDQSGHFRTIADEEESEIGMFRQEFGEGSEENVIAFDGV